MNEILAYNRAKSPSTIATTTKSETTVSTFVQREQIAIDALSEADQSQTSFASSVGGGLQSYINVPPPPEDEGAFGGNPFECPFCFSIIRVTDHQSWK